MTEPSRSNTAELAENQESFPAEKPLMQESVGPQAVPVSGLETLVQKKNSSKSRARQKESRKRNWEEWQSGRETSGFLRFAAANTAILGVIFLGSYFLLGGIIHDWVMTIPEMKLGSKVNLAFITGLLASDCVLPIEQSQVCSFAVEKLGRFKGFAVCLVGLTASSIIPFFLANHFVPPVLRAKISERVIQKRRRMVKSWGPWAIIISKGIPILSEMTSFYIGCYRLSWFRFLLPTVASAAGISLFFVAFREISLQYVFVVPLFSFWGGLIGILLILTEGFWLPILTGDGRANASGRKRKKRRSRRS